MAKQEGVVLNSIVYEKVTSAIEDLQDKHQHPDRWTFEVTADCRVIWESEEHAHPTTSYVIEGFGSELGETTMRIRGGGGSGGLYEIIPKPNNQPWIRYHPPNQNKGWEEELQLLMVVTPEFEYVKEKGWAGFFTEVYSIVEDLTNQK
jgi:hypothetical protein